jgi:hypothetical protein
MQYAEKEHIGNERNFFLNFICLQFLVGLKSTAINCIEENKTKIWYLEWSGMELIFCSFCEHTFVNLYFL